MFKLCVGSCGGFYMFFGGGMWLNSKEIVKGGEVVNMKRVEWGFF